MFVCLLCVPWGGVQAELEELRAWKAMVLARDSGGRGGGVPELPEGVPSTR
mgnify:CR=1 FL=1|tara:strand:+ start:8 stop:160 length:153 start_codon:yes stop_codon:yes gene_type:complete